MHAQGSHVDKALSTFVAYNSRNCPPCWLLESRRPRLLLPAWFFMCLFILLLEMNPSQHRAQGYGLWGMWIFLCTARMTVWKILFTVGAYVGLVDHVFLLVGLQSAPVCDTHFTHFTLIGDVPCDNVPQIVHLHRKCLAVNKFYFREAQSSLHICGLSTQTTVLWFVLCVYPWDWQSRMRCRNHLHSRCRHWVRCSRVVSSECTRILCRQRLFHTCCTSMTWPPYDFPYGLPDIF